MMTKTQPGLLPAIHLTSLNVCVGKQGWHMGIAAETQK